MSLDKWFAYKLNFAVAGFTTVVVIGLVLGLTKIVKYLYFKIILDIIPF